GARSKCSGSTRTRAGCFFPSATRPRGRPRTAPAVIYWTPRRARTSAPSATNSSSISTSHITPLVGTTQSGSVLWLRPGTGSPSASRRGSGCREYPRTLDVDRRGARVIDRLRRLDRRERGAAADRPRAADDALRRARRPVVPLQRLPPHAFGAADPGGRAVRLLRPPAHVPSRPHRLRRHERPVRARAEHGVPRCVAHPAGRSRGAPRSGFARDPHIHI